MYHSLPFLYITATINRQSSLLNPVICMKAVELFNEHPFVKLFQALVRIVLIIPYMKRMRWYKV